MARAGQKLRLECSIAGQPQPQVTWLHNAKSIKETRDTKFHFDGTNATLVITEAFPKDAGSYTIVARNKAGEAVSSCNVSVKGRLPMETSDSEIASDIEPAKPQVKQQLEDQTVFEGKKVRMDCIIVGQPEPEVIWYHNGKPVKESDDFQLLFEGDRCTLVIEVAYLEDAGTYKCVAINSGGEASSTCQLTVKPVDVIQKSQFNQKDILLTVEKFESPKFLKLLESVSAVEGETITLECQVSGEIGTSVAWFKDGSQISDGPDHQVVSDESGTHKLIIPSAKVSDKGTYSVKAQSTVGDAQSICSVSVSPSGPVVFGQTPQEVPPTFLQHVENQTLPLGATVRFETVVEGTPKPTVRWNYKGKPVPKDFRHEAGSDGDKKHWLTIRDLKTEHFGRYSAIAENNSGIATTSALLNLQDDSPTELTFEGEEQRAQSMIMSKKKTVVQTSTISSMSELSDSDYQLPEFPSFSSLQSQELVKKEQSTTTTPPISLPPVLTPAEPKPETRTVDHDHFSVSQALPDYLPPKFTKPVSTEIVTVGEKLLLEAFYEGIPEPKIQWLKDEVELKNKPGLQISSAGCRTSLFILKSSETDSGRYSCTASNVCGKATSVADVKVKPIREAPRFRKKFDATVIRSGCRMTLEVEVSGTPVPEVQWYRNGTPLNDSPDFRISSNGIKHTLIINEVFPDDSGTFMVVASNVAGEARCVADLIVEEEKSPDEEKHINYEVFSSMSQTKQMFTKISTSQPVSVEPYGTEVKTVLPPFDKVPSPPPIPAVCAKVWNQTKPSPFPAPAITEAPEPVTIPSPEPEELTLALTSPPVDVQADFTSTHTTTSHEQNVFPVVSSMSESFVKKSVMKFSQPDASSQPPTSKSQSMSKIVLEKPVQNGFDVPVQPSSSISQSTFVSESRSFMSTGTASSSLTDVPKPSFVPKSLSSFQSEVETNQSKVPIWQPKKIFESKYLPQPSSTTPAANLSEKNIIESKSFTQTSSIPTPKTSGTSILDSKSFSHISSSPSTNAYERNVFESKSFSQVNKLPATSGIVESKPFPQINSTPTTNASVRNIVESKSFSQTNSIPTTNAFERNIVESKSFSQTHPMPTTSVPETNIFESRSFSQLDSIPTTNFSGGNIVESKSFSQLDSTPATNASGRNIVESKSFSQTSSTVNKTERIENIYENVSTSKAPPFLSDDKSTSCNFKNDTSTTSCQTSTTPSFFDSESSVTTRTSSTTRTEEISITKKYELVLEHSSETIVSSEDDRKAVPKPIIKKEVHEKPKVKKEVVIEEEPVLGAEVVPPLFSKVRGAESLRKIYSDI